MGSTLSKHTLEIGGDLTICSISSVFEKVSSAIASNGSLEIRIDESSDVDLTFVQLIESARRTAERNGVTLTLASAAAGQLRDTLERGGFLTNSGATSAQFWQAEL